MASVVAVAGRTLSPPVVVVACGRVSRGVCARIAGVDRAAFDEALFVRHIPSYTSEMLDQDLAAWKKMGQE